MCMKGPAIVLAGYNAVLHIESLKPEPEEQDGYFHLPVFRTVKRNIIMHNVGPRRGELDPCPPKC